jgi:2,6-dihydroxypseudooxynicotine hydrolase
MPDRRVSTAMEHWAPRFTAQGVDPADLARIAAAIDDWDGWCPAWRAMAAEHEDLGRAALESGRTLSGGRHLAQAALYYHFAKFMAVHDLTQLRGAHQRSVSCLTDALPYLDPPGERVLIPFGGAELAGIVRRPASAGDPDRRPGLGQGRVPLRRGGVPAPRPGHLLRRRPWSG